MATMEEELCMWRRTRSNIKGQFTKIYKHLQNVVDISEYEHTTRLTTIQKYEERFDGIQERIEKICSNPQEESDLHFLVKEEITQLKLMLFDKCTAKTSPTPALQNRIQENISERHHTPKIHFQPFQEQESFKNFVKRLETYLHLTNCRDPKMMTYVLLSSLSPELHGRAYDVCAPEDPTKLSFQDLVHKLEQYIDPKPSVWARRHKFITRIQGDNETVANFSTELKRLAHDCEFSCDSCRKPIADNFLALQFIRGIRDCEIRTKILQDNQTTNFNELVQLASSSEIARADNKFIVGKMDQQNEVPVHIIKKKQNTYVKPGTSFRVTSLKDLQGKCYRCGDADHRANVCRHINVKCTKCNKMGHLARVCLQTVRQNSNNQIDEPDVVDTESICDINAIRFNSTDKFMINVNIENKKVQMELDTGAALSSMSLVEFTRLRLGNRIFKTGLRMKTYTGELITPVGVAYVKCNYRDQPFHGKLYIIRQDVDAIFGRAWIRDVKLNIADINKVSLESTVSSELDKIIAKYSPVFDGKLGHIPNYKGHLSLSEDATPIYIKPRRMPYALKEKVDNEIDRLCQEGIITKIDNSEWGTPVVPIVKPNGTIRLCADYKVTLNKMIKDEQYPIPIIEDIFAEMNGGEFYCTLDICQAYLNMQMDEESAMLQALSTHKGTFRVNRLMFGVKVAPNLWQKFMDRTLQDIQGVKCFFDDIIIQGATEKQLQERLEKVLQKLQENNLKLNKDKCTFFKKSINYLGHTIDSQGLHKNKEKIRAILDADKPININELRTFLGMSNYYNKFIPNLASIASPLNKLLQKNIQFTWTDACEQSFNKIKEEIVSNRILLHFDINKPLVLATDASPTGLGAVLSHRLPDGSDRPIAFASRSLTSSEKKYSQIDKEATAIYWGVKKFFHYCYGRKFTLITDHKPLTTIFHPHKTLPAMSTMRLFHYAHFLSGFDYNIEYRNSVSNSNADFLSRFPVEKVSEHKIDQHTAFQQHQLNVLTINCDKIAEEILKDPEYIKLIEMLKKGQTLRTLGYNDNEITLENNCLIKGTRVMIPQSLRSNVLKELHLGHLGILKMKILARSYVYWRGIDKDIEELVSKCRECRLKQNEPNKGPIHHWEVPSKPWQRIHIDFAGPLQGYYLLIIVDALSKWVEIIPTKTTTSAWCISKLKELFVDFGLPYVLVSDNGRQFVSKEFSSFLKQNGVVHKTSVPYHPATNGQAERFVQTVKKALHAMDAVTESIQDKILKIKYQLRRTPNTATGKSPYEQMFGNRTVRTLLHAMLNRNQVQPKTSMEHKLTVRTFKSGQRVQIRNYNTSKRWEFGTVLTRIGHLHYEVLTDSGQTWKRHIDQMLSTAVEKDHED